MKTRSNQSGFSAVELITVVLVIAVLGFVGYSVYNRQHKTDTAVTTTSQTPADTGTGSKVGAAPGINSTSDLNKALNTLNQNDPDTANSSDSSQLSAQTNGL
jgi:prepilin-type N-terminal cleavage/methylation domain-containing protein